MQAQFIAACTTPDEIPAPDLPEVAIAGRSNCGKSSLINALTGHSKLARTSSTPGRTQQIIIFRLKPADGQPFQLADLPGYGYAKASKKQQHGWQQLVNHYIQTRSTLGALVVLVDCRRQAQIEEQNLLQWTQQLGLKALVVLTKSDKLNKSQRFSAIKAVRKSLGLERDPLICSIHDPPSVQRLREELFGLLDAVRPAPLP